MLASIYTTSIAQNDKGVINISGLSEELERVLEQWKMCDGMLFPALYADDIYDFSSVIVKQRDGHHIFHQRMSTARIDIEHEFGLTSNLLKRLHAKHTWHILSLQDELHYYTTTLVFF